MTALELENYLSTNYTAKQLATILNLLESSMGNIYSSVDIVLNLGPHGSSAVYSRYKLMPYDKTYLKFRSKSIGFEFIENVTNDDDPIYQVCVDGSINTIQVDTYSKQQLVETLADYIIQETGKLDLTPEESLIREIRLGL